MAKIPITTSFRKRSALLNRPVLVWFLIMTCIMMIYPSRKPAQAGYFSDNFIDPSDGNFDVGPWLAEKKGLLPVPILITEPAIGYGGGLAVLYFHGKLGGKSAGDRFEATTDERGRISPPSISGVFGGATENDTWFYGGFHQGIWKNDRIRYIGALAETSLKLNFYGLDGGDGTLGNNPVEYTLDATFLLQRIQFRILDSDVFVGGQYLFMDSGSKFDSSDEITGIPSPEFDIRSGGVGLSISYDTRDNIITPNKGWFAQITASDFGKTWGGDDDFNRYGGQVIFYHDIFPELVLGLRGDGNMVSGDAPFTPIPLSRCGASRPCVTRGKKSFRARRSCGGMSRLAGVWSASAVSAPRLYRTTSLRMRAPETAKPSPPRASAFVIFLPGDSGFAWERMWPGVRRKQRFTLRSEMPG